MTDKEADNRLDQSTRQWYFRMELKERACASKATALYVAAFHGVSNEYALDYLEKNLPELQKLEEDRMNRELSEMFDQ